MAKLIYATPTSLDGYIADENYDWAAPDEEGFAFINDLLRPIGMYLYGRTDVRDDGDLGDARRHSWSDAGHAGLRADLASDRQDRLLQIAGDRLYTEDAS